MKQIATTVALASLILLAGLPPSPVAAQSTVAEDDAESYTTGFEDVNQGTGFATGFTAQNIGPSGGDRGEAFLGGALEGNQSFGIDSDAGSGGDGYAVTRALSTPLGSGNEYRIEYLVEFDVPTDEGETAGFLLSSKIPANQTSWNDGERFFLGVTGTGHWTVRGAAGTRDVPAGGSPYAANRNDVYRVRVDVAVGSDAFELLIMNESTGTMSDRVTGTLAGSSGSEIQTLGFGNGVVGSGYNLFFDGLRVTQDPSDAIPVELATFQATVNGTRAQLRWATASESKNAGFNVQHARGDSPFHTIGWRKGTGTSSETTRYAFPVDDLSPGTHRFRLQQVDTDGTTTLSDPVSVQVGLENAVVLKAPIPNPVRTSGMLRFGVQQAQPVTVELFNVLGQKVQTLYRGTPTPGHLKRVRLDAQALASGVYIVRMTGASIQKTQRLSVVR